MSAPISQIAGASNWFETIAASGIVSLLVGIVLLLPTQVKQNWYRILVVAWLVLVGGRLGKWCTEIWPDGPLSAGISIILLALAMIAGLDGKKRACRCTVVLAWIAGLLFAGIIGAGLSDLNGDMLQLRVRDPLPKGTFLFLIPAVSAHMGSQKRKASLWIPLSVWLITAVITLWTCMMIPERVAQYAQWPFYEACKNLRLFGSVERFESLASVAVSIGYFALFSLLLSAIGETVGEIKEEWAKPATVIGAVLSVGMVLLFNVFDEKSIFAGGIVLLILIPALWNLKSIIKK